MRTGSNGRARLGMLAAMSLVLALAWPAAAGADEKLVAHIKLSGQVLESPPAFSLMMEEDRHTLRSYVGRLDAAAKDANVRAVIVTIDGPQFGWAQMLELRSAFKRVRDARKPLWVYMEQAEAIDYLLACGADEVAMAPGGAVGLVGLNMQMVFFKGLLDKVGVRADMVQIGKFKGAEEPFTRTEPSPQMLGELNRLLDGLYAQMVRSIADGRKLAPDKVKAVIDAGPYLADDARKAGLVDRVASRSGVVEALKTKLGGAVGIDPNYGVPGRFKFDLSNPFSLLKLLLQEARPRAAGQRIALVYIDGVIVSGKSEEGLFGGRSAGSETIRKALDRARRDPEVKAIVLRIDSPGGSALASDVMWQAVCKAAEAKPLVVSVGGMAASGGYYVAAGAPTVFAEPTSVVGSIGVVGGKLVVGPLLEKIGVSTTALHRGANAALFDPTVPFTDEQRRFVRVLMEKVYGQFLDRVKVGRGGRIKDLDAVAQGRIFLGAEARDNGLVDRIGGLDDAIRFAAGKARIEKYDIEVMPPPKTLIDLLTGAFGEDEARTALAAWQRSVLGARTVELTALGRLLPAQLRQLSAQLTMARLLQGEQVLAAWPCAIEVK